MAILTDQQMDELADRLALRLNAQGCSCGLTQEARSEMTHIIGVIKDQGDGSYAKGAEVLRKTMEFNKEQRKIKNIIIGASLVVAVTACVGWLGAAVLEAVRGAVK